MSKAKIPRKRQADSILNVRPHSAESILQSAVNNIGRMPIHKIHHKML